MVLKNSRKKIRECVESTENLYAKTFPSILESKYSICIKLTEIFEK